MQMKAVLQAVGSPCFQGPPLCNLGVSLSPSASRPGSRMKKTGRQPALALFLHCGFIGFSLMGLSLSQEEAGWEGSHKTKASQLMNAAPGGKDRGAAVVVGHAGLSWPSTASQGRGPSLLGEEMSEQPPLPSTPLVPHTQEGLRSPAHRVAIPTLRNSPQHLAGGMNPASVSCNHLLTNVQCCLPWGDFAPLPLLSPVLNMQLQTPAFSLQVHMLSKV